MSAFNFKLLRSLNPISCNVKQNRAKPCSTVQSCAPQGCECARTALCWLISGVAGRYGWLGPTRARTRVARCPGIRVAGPPRYPGQRQLARSHRRGCDPRGAEQRPRPWGGGQLGTPGVRSRSPGHAVARWPGNPDRIRPTESHRSVIADSQSRRKGPRSGPISSARIFTF